jgi:NAD(P)-dependent dehydrogenase (short-subunit alcohol dehydrogenase family)
MTGERPVCAGQTALITGGAKRLGRRIAEALAAAGAGIVVHYGSSRAEAEALVEELRAKGGGAWGLQAGLGDVEGAARTVERASELAGAPVDILVNNASIFGPSGALEFSLEELDRNLRVNALSPLMLSRGLAAQGSPGQIINLLDTRMLEYDVAHAAYHLSKRMLFTFTRMLALELAPEIRVNAVAPGLILPPPGEDECYLEAMSHTVPLQCYGGPGDIASAVMFLVSSPFVTGQVIYVDGGRHLYGRVYGS